MRNTELLVKRLLFVVFFASGFCGLTYQMVWLRLAYASFGINAQVLSVVISVFMLGLALGSWLAGGWIIRLAKAKNLRLITLYALTELLIGFSAIAVPFLFSLGRKLLLDVGQTNSLTYLALSALIITASVLPWSFLMGTTIPLMIGFANEELTNDERIFSYLYLANTLGAAVGALATVFALIELFGLRVTMLVAAGLNLAIALTALIIRRSVKMRHSLGHQTLGRAKTALPHLERLNARQRTWAQWTLFASGFCSMGLEVVWTRLFTPLVSTTVYAFAYILILYLVGTCLGLYRYRRDAKRSVTLSTKTLLVVLAFTCFGQIPLNDPRLRLTFLAMTITILLFSGLLGYLTPKLVDDLSRGSAREAGRAYAVNILGCILGPVITSYWLLPLAGARLAIVLLCSPILVFVWQSLASAQPLRPVELAIIGSLVALALGSLVINSSYEDGLALPDKLLKRDYNATVVAYTSKEIGKQLLVNGVGMTTLTPITKIMAHLPLSLEPSKPAKALIICFGMGTTYRSSLSWGIDTTAVELTPSVADSFSYFFADAGKILTDPRGHIVIDDGRRYLQRNQQKYDLIVIDPPPPPEAAGSSLLYSKEFYQIAKGHLSKEGILAQWYPGDKGLTLQAVARSLDEVFPHVVAYQSTDNFGFHLLASNSPILNPSASELIARMPEAAQYDLMEWNGGRDASIESYLQRILAKRLPINELLGSAPAITDDRPYNEFFVLRHL